MQAKSAIVIAVGVTAMSCAAALAQDVGDYRTIASGDWGNASIWETYDGSIWQPASVGPDCSNAISVSSGQTVTIDSDQSCASFNVDGKLVIAEGRLTVCAAGPSVVGSGGQVEIGDLDAAGTLAFSSSHTVQGGGSISGQHADSQLGIIRPSSGLRKLTSKMTIEGKMTMMPFGTGAGQAAFENARTSTAEEGAIVANSDGVFKLHADLVLDDTDYFSLFIHYRPLYRAEGESATLQLNRASDGSDGDHPILAGRFESADCGTIECLDSVGTYGLLNLLLGSLTTDGPGVPCFSYNFGSLVQIDICDSLTIGSCD